MPAACPTVERAPGKKRPPGVHSRSDRPHPYPTLRLLHTRNLGPGYTSVSMMATMGFLHRWLPAGVVALILVAAGCGGGGGAKPGTGGAPGTGGLRDAATDVGTD